MHSETLVDQDGLPPVHAVLAAGISVVDPGTCLPLEQNVSARLVPRLEVQGGAQNGRLEPEAVEDELEEHARREQADESLDGGAAGRATATGLKEQDAGAGVWYCNGKRRLGS